MLKPILSRLLRPLKAAFALISRKLEPVISKILSRLEPVFKLLRPLKRAILRALDKLKRIFLRLAPYLSLVFSRLLQGLIVLLIVSALTFALLAAAGGDALTSLRSDPLVSEKTLEEQRRVYGLDQPLPIRYVRWLAGVTRGQMGESFSFRAPVWTIIKPRLVNTLTLALVALIIAWLIALTLGSLAARRPRSWIDKLAGALVLLASSTPRIVLALIALAVAARTSVFSAGSDNQTGSPLNILLPALVLAFPLIALFLAQVREGLGTALKEEFVQVARAKGLSEKVVVLRHALRAALNPLITIFGYSLGGLVSGSVIVETVLGWQGLGHLSVMAVRSRDVPLMMGVLMVTATAVLIGNLVADILLRLNDPRLREASGGGGGEMVVSRNATAAAATNAG